MPAVCRRREQLYKVDLHAILVHAVHIRHQRPDLNAKLMRFRHIGGIGKTAKISAVVIQPKPCRRHDIDSSGSVKRVCQLLSPDFLKHLMEREIDPPLLLDIMVHDLLKSRIACPLCLLFAL